MERDIERIEHQNRKKKNVHCLHRTHMLKDVEVIRVKIENEMIQTGSATLTSIFVKDVQIPPSLSHWVYHLLPFKYRTSAKCCGCEQLTSNH